MMRVFRLTRVGFAIALAYWCVDSCVDAFIFREGTLIDQLLAPTPAEIWVRLAFGLAVLCASTYAQYTIDNLRDAELQIKRSEERLQLALDGADEGLWDWNIQTGEVVISDLWSNMLGYEREEMGFPLEKWFEITHADDREFVEAAMRAHLRGETEYYETRHRLKSKSGDYVWVLDKGRVVERDENGRGVRLAGTQIDISRQVRSEEERAELLEQIQKNQRLESMGVFAGGIAHDFNNILVGVLGYAELADDRVSDDLKTKEYLSEIVSSSLRLSQLCQHLLAYAGRRIVDVQSIDLVVHLRNLENLLGITVSKRASLKFDLPDTLPSIQADPIQLDQVVLNLVTNASDALENEVGTIRVALGEISCSAEDLKMSYLATELPPGQYIYLDVEDDGIGMDSQTVDRIFEPFFTTKFTGRGIGLASVLGILRGHHGALTVESTPGKGTSIRILLPVETVAADPVSPLIEEVSDANDHGLILLVDDEELVREVAREMLTQSGFDVILAKDGIEAIEIYEERGDDIDCVLLDLLMPRMGGEETFAELRRIDENVRVILASGYAKPDVIEQLSTLAFVDFLQKPFLRSTLLRTIRNALNS